MSDDDDAMTNGTNSAVEDDEERNQGNAERNDGSSSDDDSSSSSSGSSSSSSDSDSESEKEDEGNDHTQKQSGGDYADRKYSIESLTSSSQHGASNGLSHRSDAREKANAEPLNVNTTRAAARFREQASSEPGMMALGTKKRDRRTIEEIQRDLQMKRGRSGSIVAPKKPLGSGTATSSSSSSMNRSAGSSPPKRSPVMSPDSGTEMDRISLGLPMDKASGALKSKANSARSRLEKKLLGRGGGGSSRPSTAATAKSKPTTKPMTAGGGSSNSTSGTSALPGTTPPAINISKPATKPSGSSSSDHDSSVGETSIHKTSSSSTPDGRVIRAVLRAMLRYGDLTDVNLFVGADKSFSDEYKLPNFILRSNLDTQCKMSESALLKLASEIVESVQRAIEDKRDAIKFLDVEIKPSQVVERLYENLKLRVAVQRALYDTGVATSKGASGVYTLVAKHYDVTVLGIGRDVMPWTWAEKEHDWNSKKDAALLLGIYVYGFGAWEDILNDDQLALQKQRALKGERLKKRAENLLKRLPPPTSAGEPKLVALASVLAGNASTIGAGQPTVGASLGAQIKAIANGASVNGGRMHRAAERAAARQASGGSSSSSNSTTTATTQSHSSRVIPEDSIRKVHTQAASLASIRKGSISSSPALAPSRDHDRLENGEIKSTASSSEPHRGTHTKRSGEDHDRSDSPRKRTKRDRDATATSSSTSIKTTTTITPVGRVRLSTEEILDKWKPSKRLKDIRQVLKKMKIMADWSKNQKDEVVVEKVYKYVTTIGEAIDRIVLESDEAQRVNKADATRGPEVLDWDELGTALWTYAAEYTPFAPVAFERLYDDICADGDRLREEARQDRHATR